jgi:hypothetical protein
VQLGEEERHGGSKFNGVGTGQNGPSPLVDDDDLILSMTGCDT